MTMTNAPKSTITLELNYFKDLLIRKGILGHYEVLARQGWRKYYLNMSSMDWHCIIGHRDLSAYEWPGISDTRNALKDAGYTGEINVK